MQFPSVGYFFPPEKFEFCHNLNGDYGPQAMGVFGFWCSLLGILICAMICVSARSDKETRERFYGDTLNSSSSPESNDGSLAKIFDRVLEKEFSENDQPEGSDGSSFNSSVADQQGGPFHCLCKRFPLYIKIPFVINLISTLAAELVKAVLETVAKINREKPKRNETRDGNGTGLFQFQDVFSLDNEGSEDLTTLIDKKDNVFVMSNKKSKYPVLQVD